MNYINDFLNFINNSPVSYFAIKNVKDVLVNNGYIELKEDSDFSLAKGKKYFVIREDGAVIAFNVGKSINKNTSFNIIASHADSPCFKLKEVFDAYDNEYNKILVEPYGGLILSTWLDRPLSVAGKINVKNNEEIISKFINIDKDLLMIPNMCPHFSREIQISLKDDYKTFMLPFLSNETNGETLMNIICKEANVNKDDVVNHDLYVYNRNKAMLLGNNGEYLCAPRLDDLACVYTSLIAFLNQENKKTINMLYVANHEEIGSDTNVGAGGDFLVSVLNKIQAGLNFDEEEFKKIIANSYFVSADNAHAVHPNVVNAAHPIKRAHLNKGLVIKKSERYATSKLSSAISVKAFEDHNIPYQHYENPIGVRGGSTLGVIVLRQIPILGIDVGIPQLAMHSSYETIGSHDIENVINAFKVLYSLKLKIKVRSFKAKYVK